MTATERRKPWTDTQSENDADDLRVIGVGLPRTGTTSLKNALEILWFGPCHHMVELFAKPERTVEFIRALDGEKVDFRQLMKGYGSTLDSPTTDFYREIHQAYPRAKLILTVRDSNEKWFESFQKTIAPLAQSSFYLFCVYPLRFLRLQGIMGRKIIKKWRREYGPLRASIHDLHNQRVIEENKTSELLVYNVKEGWAPLCNFLGVDVPENTPFPNVNDAKEFNRLIVFGKLMGLLVWTGVQWRTQGGAIGQMPNAFEKFAQGILRIVWFAQALESPLVSQKTKFDRGPLSKYRENPKN